MDKKNINKKLDTEITIYCSSCEYEFPATRREAIHDWHNEPCPECHSPKIINDYDVHFIREVTRLELLQDQLLNFVKRGSTENEEIKAILKTHRDEHGNNTYSIEKKDDL